MPLLSRIRHSSTPTERPRHPRAPKSQVSKGPPLRLSPSLSALAGRRILSSVRGLPVFTGGPIFVSAAPQLTAHRGKLLSARPGRGTPVHAASFIRRRQVVLETELLTKPDLSLILLHELFHFVWARLGNAKRASYAALLSEELRLGARGELGESSSVRKQIAVGSRDYVCESFCDTAAWLYADRSNQTHVTLARRWLNKRKDWFSAHVITPVKC